MYHRFEKIEGDSLHDRYRIIIQPGKEDSTFARVFDLKSTTHRLAAKREIVADGDGKRDSIALWMQPLGPDEIGRKSRDFNDLSDGEITELLDRLNGVLDRRKRPDTAKPPASAKPALVVPASVSKLSDADLEVRAAELGVKTKPGPWRPQERGRIEREVAAKSE